MDRILSHGNSNSTGIPSAVSITLARILSDSCDNLTLARTTPTDTTLDYWEYSTALFFSMTILTTIGIYIWIQVFDTCQVWAYSSSIAEGGRAGGRFSGNGAVAQDAGQDIFRFLLCPLLFEDETHVGAYCLSSRGNTKGITYCLPSNVADAFPPAAGGRKASLMRTARRVSYVVLDGWMPYRPSSTDIK